MRLEVLSLELNISQIWFFVTFVIDPIALIQSDQKIITVLERLKRELLVHDFRLKFYAVYRISLLACHRYPSIV